MKNNDRYLPKTTICERTGKSYPTIWKWMREDRFPRSFMVGGRAMWLESEFVAWMESQPRTRLKGDDED